jgi:hypothetical protein
MKLARRIARPVLATAIAVLAAGCQGRVTAGDESTGAGPGSAPPASAPRGTARRLWRLNNTQVENVLGELLGTRLSITAGFLPDPRVEGYDNDAVALGVFDGHIDELATAAERAADFVSQAGNLPSFAPCAGGDDPASCAVAFARGFARKAWGRPPSDGEVARLADVFRAGSDPEGYASGIALVTEAVLQSPHFIYRLELGAPAGPGVVRLTADELASALSFSIVGSRPDAELLDQAAAGDLSDPEVRARQARRLLGLPESRRHLARFLRAWLGMDGVARLNKDTGVFPFFTNPVRQALDRELELFLDNVLISGGRLTELMFADYSYPSPILNPIYGVDLLDSPGDFVRVRLASRRRGLLSSPAFLASHGLADQTNPVQRGLVVLNRLFCLDLPPPPPAVAGQGAPGGGPDTTTRQRHEAHRSQAGCSACHALIDPPGFGFEMFDSVGRFQDTERGQPVDSAGGLVGTDVDGPFTGPSELARRLLDSAQFNRCFTQQLWRFLEGRGVDPADGADIGALAARFTAGERRLDELIVELVRRPAFALRREIEEMP